jgi:hypothetical protein
MQPDAYERRAGEDAGARHDEWRSRKPGRAQKGITSFDKVQRMGVYDWFQPDVVYVAEYFEVERSRTR